MRKGQKKSPHKVNKQKFESDKCTMENRQNRHFVRIADFPDCRSVSKFPCISKYLNESALVTVQRNRRRSFTLIWSENGVHFWWEITWNIRRTLFLRQLLLFALFRKTSLFVTATEPDDDKTNESKENTSRICVISIPFASLSRTHGLTYSNRNEGIWKRLNYSIIISLVHFSIA